MLRTFMLSTTRGGRGVKLLLLALIIASAALLASTNQTSAQSCQMITEDLGVLSSDQTITRHGILVSSDCQGDNDRYYDRYTFELPGAGEVTAQLSAPDFKRQIQYSASTGDILAFKRTSLPNSVSTLTRGLPAGRHQVVVTSHSDVYSSWRDSPDVVTGPYTLTIKTGQLAAPPPPPTAATGEGQKTPPADTETIRGRVIARIHPLPENDQQGNYRIEFGFLSEGVLSSGTDRTAVVAANAHLLPSRRYLNEAALLARAQDNDRRWLRSSPIDVFPLTGDDANLESEPLLTGRVIARWNPTTENRFRIEFGFLPDWAFEAAGDDTALAVELYSGQLPTPARYLAENRINSETARSAPRWLASSLVEIEAEPEPDGLEDDDSMGAGDEPDRVNGGSEPPPVPASNYFRCGSDSIRVYWFDRTNGSKHWLNMTGAEATAIFGGDWWNTIGHVSQSNCDRLPTGRNRTTADYGR